MGLHAEDLRDLVDAVFEVDSYQSKMGEDKDIVTLSFKVKEKAAATDLSNFLEKGYEYILDADITPGEQSDGKYRVFVELERNKNVPDQIVEIMSGVSRLSGNEEFKFRYYKSFKSHSVDEETLSEVIPQDPDSYNISIQENSLNNYKEFFNKSYVDEIEMNENVLTVKKKYADPLHFEFVDFGDTIQKINQINETFDVLNSYPEIMFLTKYLGDYNICKYGEKLVFENDNKSLIVKRI